MADEYPSEVLTFQSGEAGAYDALHAIYLALQKGATTGEEIKNILPSIEFDGVSTHVKFDENGEITSNYSYDLLQVKNGKPILLEK